MTEAAAQPSLTIAVLRERSEGERRVAVVPRSVGRLAAAGVAVRVEAGAGVTAGHADEAYVEAGAQIGKGIAKTVAGAGLLLCVTSPVEEVAGKLARGSAVAGLLRPSANRSRIEALAKRGVDAFSLELLPRTTRAQEMDALSSMSTVSGYHGTLLAATLLPRFMPLLMTAAGTIRPARVLVIGAGVAGLQAIATARRLGAVVEAFDVRAAAREQVESLGARFVDIDVAAEEVGTGYAGALSSDAEEREREVLAAHVADADAVITTALIAGGAAPKLITRAMVEGMKSGSVIVDLAAEGGGNTEVTEPGQEVSVGGVTVCGPLDLPSRMAADASQLYSHNVSRFALHLIADGALHVDLDDDITGATCVARHGVLRGPLAAARDAVA
jgi:NAD(P) transhydrogenase subunit alpha